MMNDILPTLERTFRGHSGDVVASSFHPNLQQMASGSVDNNVMLWSFKTSMRALRYVGHTDVVHGVSFSPDGRLVASCSADTTIRLWIPTVKGLCTTLKAHASTVRAVQFSNDNRTLISASDDKSVKLWSVSAQKFLRTYSGHNNWVRSVVMSPDGRVIASGGDDRQLLLFDTNSKSIVHSFHENTEAIRCVQFSPDGTCVAAAGVDGCIKVWDLRTLSLLEHYDAHEDIVTGISYHAGGNWMISSSLDGTTKVWDVKEGFLYFTMESHAGAVHSANFSPCGSMFATTGADTSIMVWSANFARSISSSISTNKSRTDICAQRDQELSSNTKVAVRTPDVTRKRIESRHVDPRNNFLSTVPNHQFVTVHEDALGSRQRSATQPTLSGTGESNENKILRNPRVCPPVPLVSESCETIETRVSNAQHKSNSHSISTGAEKRRESRTGSDNDAMNFTLVETIQSLICQLELMRGTQELMETRIGTLENALRESFSRSVEREVSLIERVDDLTLQMEALKRKHESE